MPVPLHTLLQLYQKFPNMPMVLGLAATKPPTLVVNPSTANFTIPGQVTVFVINQNKTAEVAFVLGMVSVKHFFGGGGDKLHRSSTHLFDSLIPRHKNRPAGKAWE